MKTLKESLFDNDLVKKDLPVDSHTLLSYIAEKIKEVKKQGVNVDVDGHPGDYYVIHFESPELIYPDKQAYEIYNMKIGIRFNKNNIEIRPYIVYGINKGIEWCVKRIDPHNPGTNRYVSDVSELNIAGYTHWMFGEHDPRKLYDVIDGYFDIFKSLNDYRIFNSLDDTEKMNLGQIINKVYDKLKKIWPKVPKLNR
jgi:hypothetical protein